MKFRIIKGGLKNSIWSNTIQVRKFRWFPWPRFVWGDYKLGPWFGRFAGGTAYAKDEFYDRNHQEALGFIEREKARHACHYEYPEDPK